MSANRAHFLSSFILAVIPHYQSRSDICRARNIGQETNIYHAIFIIVLDISKPEGISAHMQSPLMILMPHAQSRFYACRHDGRICGFGEGDAV